eukprot:5769607-Amphidinium_carterae.1
MENGGAILFKQSDAIRDFVCMQQESKVSRHYSETAKNNPNFKILIVIVPIESRCQRCKHASSFVTGRNTRVAPERVCSAAPTPSAMITRR